MRVVHNFSTWGSWGIIGIFNLFGALGMATGNASIPTPHFDGGVNLSVIPNWLTIASFILSMLLAAANIYAASYKKMREADAKMIEAERDKCKAAACEYRIGYFKVLDEHVKMMD